MGVEAVMCITDELISLCYEGSKLLPAAQSLVNGYVQVIDICPNKIMIMNEEGKFHFELNVEA